jgi:hypothetical protein
MNVKVLRELHGQRPFVAFTLTLADGRKLKVPHNEFLSISPNGRSAMLFHPDDSFTLIDLLMVTSLDVNERTRPRGRSRKDQ